MIISYRHKFIFMHSRKTAGSSVTALLSHHLGPQDIQLGLMSHLGFDKVVDAHISSYEVRDGRPYPYMIHHLMERLGVESVKRVAKVGDKSLAQIFGQ